MSKLELLEAIEAIKNNALEGNINSLTAYTDLVSIKKSLELCVNQLLTSAIDEVDMYQEKTITHNGFEIRKTQSARYDYKHIDAWKSCKEDLSKIEEIAKLALKTGENIVIEETGEIIKPAIKVPSKISISVTPVKH